MAAASRNALIDELAAAPVTLRRLCDALNPAHLRLRPGPALFSPLETAWHLCDIEREGYLVRIGQILAQESPVLGSLDGDQLALERRYNEQELLPAIEGFSTARAASLRLLSRIDATAWARLARFEGQSITLCALAEMMAEHDRGHLLSVQGVHTVPIAA
jgi:hypothetical protein